MTNPPYGPHDSDKPDPNRTPEPPGYGGDGHGPGYGTQDGYGGQPGYGAQPAPQDGYGNQPGYGYGDQPGYGYGAQAGYGYGEQPGDGGYGPQAGYGGYGPGYSTPRPKGLAIASMVCGIVSLVLLCFPYLGLPAGIAAVVTGVLARKKIQQGAAEGAGMALAGLITGIVGIVICLILLILVAVSVLAPIQP